MGAFLSVDPVAPDALALGHRRHALLLAAFLKELAMAPGAPDVFNPWADTCARMDGPDAPRCRQDRLHAFLSVPPDQIHLILVGEAPGYQGCRYSGIPFTNERLLMDGVIPRASAHPAPVGFLTGARSRITLRPIPWSEPSATILWETLHRLSRAEHTVLWNAFPFHPHSPGHDLSNRRPTLAEITAGLPYLKRFCALFPQATIVAVGEVAHMALGRIGVSATRIRHPAYGGKTAFVAGLRALCSHQEVLR